MKRGSAGKTELPLCPHRPPVPAPPPALHNAPSRPSAALSLNLGRPCPPSPERHPLSPVALGCRS
eukprot:9069476-Pyramimonas_sp.AAC.1